jgi:glycosyltransferase involved in cell wall biosynthesis
MKLILVSNLYPNSIDPNRGLFNMHLMQALSQAGHDVEIIAPVAYFPGRDKAPPPVETIDTRPWTLDQMSNPAIEDPSLPSSVFSLQSPLPSLQSSPVFHPRYLYTPGFLIHHHWRFYRHAVAPLLSQILSNQEPRTKNEKQRTRNQAPPQKSLQSTVCSLQSSPSPHIILGFVYPDAVAMDAVCRKLGVSYSVLVLGSDFRIRMQQPKFRPLVLDCLKQAPLIFCPGQALANDMAAAGIDAARIHFFNNGVDPAIFFADSTPRANELLFVGNLLPVKAPERIINAFHALPDLRSGGMKLVMIGSGPLKATLQQTAAQLGIPEGQIEWTGAIPQTQLADRMRKAKLLCLCSRSEGMPNVVTEALACGTPVVATAVGEVPYMLNDQNGIAIPEAETEPDTVAQLSTAIAKALATTYDHATIAAATQHYRWARAADTITTAIQ